MFALTACASVTVPSSDDADERPRVPLNTNQIAMAGFTESPMAARDMRTYRPLKRVLIDRANEAQIDQLEKLLDGVEFVAYDRSSAPSGRFDAVILACSSPGPLDYAKGAAWIHSYSAGVEGCLAHENLRKSEPIVTNSRGTTASIIGEHAIAMTLTLARGLHRFHRAQLQQDWFASRQISAESTTTVSSKTMLVLGLGSIGKEVARRASALGMRVTATRRTSRNGPDYVDYVGLTDETLDLAAEADVIVNALPLTSSTQGLLDEQFFAVLKPGSILVSVGRGGTTDTDALIRALKNGKLAAAGLDVVDPEPLPSDHPLWLMENVLITPHIAGRGGDARVKVQQILLENLQRYQAGEPLLNPVSIQAGY